MLERKLNLDLSRSSNSNRGLKSVDLDRKYKRLSRISNNDFLGSVSSPGAKPTKIILKDSKINLRMAKFQQKENSKSRLLRPTTSTTAKYNGRRIDSATDSSTSKKYRKTGSQGKIRSNVRIRPHSNYLSHKKFKMKVKLHNFTEDMTNHLGLSRDIYGDINGVIDTARAPKKGLNRVQSSKPSFLQKGRVSLFGDHQSIAVTPGKERELPENANAAKDFILLQDEGGAGMRYLPGYQKNASKISLFEYFRELIIYLNNTTGGVPRSKESSLINREEDNEQSSSSSRIPDRDQEIRDLRKWVRFLKYFKFHKKEKALKPWLNLIFLYHILKLKIQKEIGQPHSKNRRIAVSQIYASKDIKIVPEFCKTTPLRYYGKDRSLASKGKPTMLFQQYSKNLNFDGFSIFERLSTNLRKKIAEKIRYSIISNNFGMPYIFFNPKELLPRNRNSTSSKFTYKKIVVVCLDIFGCFTQFIEFLFKKADRPLLEVHYLLFNIPGQPFTIYNSQSHPSVQELSAGVDYILGELSEAGEIDFLKDNFYFLGFGFGSMILTELLLTFGHQKQFKKFISFNGVFNQDTKIKVGLVNLTETILISDESSHNKILEVMNLGNTSIQNQFDSSSIQEDSRITSPSPTNFKDDIFLSPHFNKDSRLYLLEMMLNLELNSGRFKNLAISTICVHGTNNTFSLVEQSEFFTNKLKISSPKLKTARIPHFCLEFGGKTFREQLLNIFMNYIVNQQSQEACYLKN